MKPTPRLYSLFRRPRGGKGKWERISQFAFPKKQAISLYQNRLLNNAMGLADNRFELRIRPVIQQLELELR